MPTSSGSATSLAARTGRNVPSSSSLSLHHASTANSSFTYLTQQHKENNNNTNHNNLSSATTQGASVTGGGGSGGTSPTPSPPPVSSTAAHGQYFYYNHYHHPQHQQHPSPTLSSTSSAPPAVASYEVQPLLPPTHSYASSSSSSHHHPHHHHPLNDEESCAGYDRTKKALDPNPSILGAVRELVPLALPSILSMSVTFLLGAVPLSAVGTHLGEDSLAGASIAYFFQSIVVQYPVSGMAYALDALCSHEFGRNTRSTALGLHLQQGLVFSTIVLGLLCVVMQLLVRYALPLAYPADMCDSAQSFLLYLPLYQLPIQWSVTLGKFLSSQRLPHLVTVGMLVGVGTTLWISPIAASLGLEAAMLGMAVAGWAQFATLLILTWVTRQSRTTLGSFRWMESVGDVKRNAAYWRLALPSMIFVSAEASAFDVTVLLATGLGVAPGAAWSSIMNVLLVLSCVGGGTGNGVSILIGQAIGAGLPHRAKQCIAAALLLSLSLATFNGFLLASHYHEILALFGTETHGLKAAASVRYWIPLFHVLDVLQFTYQGIFSGSGKNHIGAKILLTSLWVVGIPLSAYWSFALHWGLFGVVFGLLVGLALEGPWMIWSMWRSDWNQICEEFAVQHQATAVAGGHYTEIL